MRLILQIVIRQCNQSRSENNHYKKKTVFGHLPFRARTIGDSNRGFVLFGWTVHCSWWLMETDGSSVATAQQNGGQRWA